MHLTRRFISLFSATAMSIMVVPMALADENVTCKSHDYKYTHCSIQSAGYVTLREQLSKTHCVQGRNWDYDRRGIWVDDGCGAKFHVENNQHSDDHHSNSSNAAAAAGVVIGAAILGALISNSNHDDKYKYNDDNYQGSRHTSYVPGWMVGKFRGYNPDYGADVVMKISSDGRVKAHIDDQKITGWINDERLHVGNTVFDIDRTNHGFVTSQVGDRHNEVRYHRVN